MGLIEILVVIILVGVLLWAVNSIIPMEPHVKQILNVIVLIVLILWLLQAFGLIGSLRAVRVN